jgi:hypothetical protein
MYSRSVKYYQLGLFIRQNILTLEGGEICLRISFLIIIIIIYVMLLRQSNEGEWNGVTRFVHLIL